MNLKTSQRTLAPVPPITAPRGFTLLEVALVLSVAGMVLAVAVPTFVDSLETSKAAEASQQLEFLFQSSAAYYAVGRQTSDGKIAFCLPAAAGPTPAIPSASPVNVDFKAPETPGLETWQALAFSPKQPLRYRYSFLPRGPACLVSESAQPAMLVLRAEGDLDGDGTFSRFERRARMREHGVLESEKLLHIADRIE